VNFGLETTIDSQKVEASFFEETRRRRHRSQTKSIFNFTDFYPWSKLHGKDGWKKGGIAEKSGESLKLDKVRENRGCWRPFSNRKRPIHARVYKYARLPSMCSL